MVYIATNALSVPGHHYVPRGGLDGGRFAVQTRLRRRAGLRKKGKFPDGLANRTYPTLSCPSRSAPVRQEAQIPVVRRRLGTGQIEPLAAVPARSRNETEYARLRSTRCGCDVQTCRNCWLGSRPIVEMTETKPPFSLETVRVPPPYPRRVSMRSLRRWIAPRFFWTQVRGRRLASAGEATEKTCDA
jgi:hypothetical protein